MKSNMRPKALQKVAFRRAKGHLLENGRFLLDLPLEVFTAVTVVNPYRKTVLVDAP